MIYYENLQKYSLNWTFSRYYYLRAIFLFDSCHATSRKSVAWAEIVCCYRNHYAHFMSSNLLEFISRSCSEFSSLFPHCVHWLHNTSSSQNFIWHNFIITFKNTTANYIHVTDINYKISMLIRICFTLKNVFKNRNQSPFLHYNFFARFTMRD